MMGACASVTAHHMVTWSVVLKTPGIKLPGTGRGCRAPRENSFNRPCTHVSCYKHQEAVLWCEDMATDLWKIVNDLVSLTDGEIVFIGGIAVHAHSAKSGLPLETTHDADAAISLAASGTVREHEEFVTNKRLGKAQIKVGDVDVDLYVERNNKLRFDYAVLAQFAESASVGRAGSFQIAALGHLLLLKIDALRSRGHSAHGAKDRRDVAKILVMSGECLIKGDEEALHIVVGHSTDSDLSLMQQVLKSTAFMEITKQNAQAAARLRNKAQPFVDRLRKERVS